MDESPSDPLENHLRTLVDLLTARPDSRSWSPEVFEQLGKVIEILGVDSEVFERFGYFEIGQSCTKLSDLFQDDQVARIKSFAHCGREFWFHVFQTRVRCPVCGTEIKTAGLFGEDDPAGVALSAWIWLGMNAQSVPGWNQECQSSWSDPTARSPDNSAPR